MSEKKFNYCLLKMGYTDGTPGTKIAFTVAEMNMKVLVGEYKIAIDRLMNNMPYTQQEYQEHMEMIKKWEQDLYD